MKKLVLINGAPRSGKDTLANLILSAYPGAKYKMTAPMDRALQTFFSFTDEEFVFHREEAKDRPFPFAVHPAARTFRQTLIHFSEEFAKPLYGEGIFGLLAARFINSELHLKETVVISDCGFQAEVETLLEHLDPEREPIFVRLERKGCSFTDDSRSYISPPLGFSSILVSNNSTPSAMLMQMEHLL